MINISHYTENVFYVEILLHIQTNVNSFIYESKSYNNVLTFIFYPHHHHRSKSAKYYKSSHNKDVSSEMECSIKTFIRKFIRNPKKTSIDEKIKKVV